MDNPIFKLEGVVHERSAETLQDFEGPLDLILFLLSKKSGSLYSEAFFKNYFYFNILSAIIPL